MDADLLMHDFPWRRLANIAPDAVAIATPTETLNWRTLAQRLDALCAGFQQQGVQAGTLVALRGKNSLTLLLAWLALMQAGATALPLNPQLPPATLQPLLSALRPDFMLNLADALMESPPPLALRRVTLPPRCRWQPDAIATLTLTSGSSGLPKAAAHRYQALLASAAGVNQLMNFTADERWLLSLPICHVSGQGIVWRWLLAGGCLAIPDVETPLAQALAGCSFASLVPTQLWRLLQLPQPPAGLKAVLLGGAAIPPELVARAEAVGIRCWCGYGLTESAATVCAKRADGQPGVGLPLSGREVRIVNEEIWIRGVTLASGYWREGQLQPLTDAQGWFHTRDRGRWHQGELQVLGRMDNLFFSGGEAVQPESIESLLLQHPAVNQAFVLPQPDEEWGARPVALLALDADGLLESVADWAQSRLASFQRPTRWLPLPEHINEGGIKLSRQRLAEWLRAQP
ncbi:o-succinylbenzoate--CoA ligase [Mixta intestinalis]|uniref:2-succinylbenzoate--CoA ligase n=1 Tax=Mixta intestinalis TaxID=1615494 RepID=A0A6P1PZG5_9GAMM|nr:o-succinylbenzoate--CoA ligase [Mixta intestinalis]QHM71783.1 2-succinylbenzoate--CoA ligase [Mixta intestinalis]